MHEVCLLKTHRYKSEEVLFLSDKRCAAKWAWSSTFSCIRDEGNQALRTVQLADHTQLGANVFVAKSPHRNSKTAPSVLPDAERNAKCMHNQILSECPIGGAFLPFAWTPLGGRVPVGTSRKLSKNCHFERERTGFLYRFPNECQQKMQEQVVRAGRPPITRHISFQGAMRFSENLPR